jgi:hypothetical protein
LSDTAILNRRWWTFLNPDEWLGCLVVCRDESIDVLPQLLDGSEGGAVEWPSGSLLDQL